MAHIMIFGDVRSNKGFLTFSGGIEMKHWFEWVNKIV